MNTMNEAIQRMQKPFLALGVAGVAATAAGWFAVERAQFFQSYLMAFLFVLAFACGSLGLLLIHHLVIGRWGFVIQRPLEAAARTFPLVALFFVPLVFGLNDLYSWTLPEALHDHVLHKKAGYLNVPFFLGRAVLFFGVWTLLGCLLSRWSKRQDAHPEEAKALELRMRKLSGIGLLIFGLAVTFSSFDWIMSLEPKWYSTLYGAHVMVGQGIAALSLMAWVAHRLKAGEVYGRVIGPQQFHDIGNLTFAFVILWAYMGIGQYIIIWSGNLPEEIEYYLHRQQGGWQYFAGVLTVFQFVIPFLLLLWKANKRRSEVLVRIAAYLLVIRFLDLLWLVTPSFRHHVAAHWLDAAAILGLAGLWMFVFLRQLASRPVLPQHDPRFESMLNEAAGTGGHAHG